MVGLIVGKVPSRRGGEQRARAELGGRSLACGGSPVCSGMTRGSGDLFEPIVVVESAEHGRGHDAGVVRQSMPVLARLNGQGFRWLGNAWAERHVRAFVVVEILPSAQDSSEMVFRQRDKEVETFSPDGSDEPLAKSVGLW